ncbi:ABC transporter ATP-binding protein [Kineosporia sp. NBRC 101731]|uniref:ABC transporter ATP-binding protein n=1 Tax=Kineosporia sp. NBRC 101731 TaxID=3032199 RepID=UPI0025525EF4|nr:ABC transporter ATP-binding protein [Kineosporia sp. NBRC 101731]
MTSLNLLRPVRAALVVAVLLQALAAVLVLVPLLVLIRFTESSLSEDPLPGTVLVVAAVAGTLGAALLSSAATWITHRADADLTWQLQTRLAETVRRVPLPLVTGSGAARIKKAVQDDTGALHYLVGHTLLDVTGLIITPLAGLVALAVIEWKLALAALIPLALGLTWYLRALNASGGGFAEMGRTQQVLGTAVVDYVHGLPTAKVYGGVGGAHTRYLSAVHGFHDFFYGWVRKTSTNTTASGLVVASGLTAAAFALLGWGGLELGWVDSGGLVAGVLLGPTIGAPVAVVGPRLQAVRSGLAAVASINAFLGQEHLAWGDRPATGSVRLEHVTHHYDNSSTALDDVSLELPGRGLVALVGASGSGKSTIASLLARFTDPSEGRVTLGGIPLREVPEDHLYEQVGFVFQDTSLRRASLLENLTGGRDIPFEDVVAAAREALIHEEISAAPRGYETVVGQDTDFSGGQRQRICLARAFLRRPGLLVLDESLSAVDAHSRRRLIQTLQVQARERTVLLITHQLPLVREADLILVLENGRLAGQGTHEHLVSTSSAYRALLQDQTTITESRI